jgi:hypothetical protein
VFRATHIASLYGASYPQGRDYVSSVVRDSAASNLAPEQQFATPACCDPCAAGLQAAVALI